jgi:DNA-binding MarR family transcriptional regulator
MGIRGSWAGISAFSRVLRANVEKARSLNDELVAEHGVTIEQLEILNRLALQGSRRQADLSEPPLVTGANLRRELANLERAGLVHRSGEAEGPDIALTDAGRETVRAARRPELDALLAMGPLDSAPARVRDSHIHVLVTVEAGSADTEEIGVLSLGNGIHAVVVPPLFAFGLAVGDEFRIDPDTGRPELTRRAGNVLRHRTRLALERAPEGQPCLAQREVERCAVWLYPDVASSAQRETVTADVVALGGTFEGAADDGRILVFTIPVKVGFPAIEAVFRTYVADDPGAQWLYGNVYADDGVTLLNWWEEAVP